ncbi:MAG: glycosyltransferase [Alphaproteobacteria bacterium]|nr:glycosyltransferase [Alphaproteobacteria bacterium]
MKKQNPTLSIITVSYNIKDTIERTCKSIVNQSWQDFEWIVVDGGSTDGTVDVLKEYADRINILISEKDKGIYNAMNKGIKLAHGEWLNFMNGGDEYAICDALEKVFKNNTYTENILQAEEERFNSDKKLAYVWRHQSPIDKMTFLKYSMAHQSAFYRRALFEKYGLYDESYKISADTEMNLRLISAGEKVKMLHTLVGRFWLDGATANPKNEQLRKIEHSRFNNIYYTRQELDDFERHQKLARQKRAEQNEWKHIHFSQKKSYRLFGFIPLLSIDDN